MQVRASNPGRCAAPSPGPDEGYQACQARRGGAVLGGFVLGQVAGVALPALLGRACAADTAAAANNGVAVVARSVDDVVSGLPRGAQRTVRIVPDEAVLRATFADLTKGGTPAAWKNYNGQVFEMANGTQIGLRAYSRSGDATIDIRVPGQSAIKIHIG